MLENLGNLAAAPGWWRAPAALPALASVMSQVVLSLLSRGKQSSQPCSCHPKQGE